MQLSPYTTPAAFRRALTDRLRTAAAPRGPWPLPDLQRQFAYDRLLVRLYLFDDAWVVKGATALLARGIAVRHTVDVDIYRASRRDLAERDLRSAIRLEAGDWFEFTAGPGIPIGDGAGAVRIPIDARIGSASWARFHLDVVAEGIRMTGQPDAVPSLTSVTIPGLATATYQAYPLVDHIADKTSAILERVGGGRHPSTRYKDLVDLVVLVGHVRVPAGAQRAALESEAGRRGFVLPERFEVPDVSLWEAGYAAEAGRAASFAVRTLRDALALVVPFLDPLLNGTATGRWDAADGRWTAGGEEPGGWGGSVGRAGRGPA